jgi:hypothetical protein
MHKWLTWYRSLHVEHERHYAPTNRYGNYGKNCCRYCWSHDLFNRLMSVEQGVIGDVRGWERVGVAC